MCSNISSSCGHSSNTNSVKQRNGGKARRALRNKIKLNDEAFQESELPTIGKESQ